MTDKTKNLTVNISFPNMILSVIFALPQFALAVTVIDHTSTLSAKTAVSHRNTRQQIS